MKQYLQIFLTSFTLYGVSMDHAYSQLNSNYWSHQYGSDGQLLNGAVIASVSDETAIFYNPGAFALNTETGVSLSLINPSFSHTRLQDLLGDGTSVSDQRLGLAPGLVAASVKPLGSKRLILGATTFTRFRSALRFNDRVVSKINDAQSFLGDVDFNRSVNETWMGASVSYAIVPRLSIGVSQFFTFRSEALRLAFKKDIVNANAPEQLQAGWSSDFSYGIGVTGGVLTKLGIIWKPGDITLGFTYTTPTYAKLATNARYAVDDRKKFIDGTTEVRSNDRNVGLQSFETPRSIGVGVAFEHKKAEISMSMEYFGATPTYTLIQDSDDPFDGQTNVSLEEEVTVTQAFDQVINIAVGVKKKLNVDKDWFYGFRTDFSPDNITDLGDGVSFLAASPDFFHISTGISRRYSRSQFSLGIDYGLGVKRGGAQLTNITNTGSENLFAFTGDNVVDTYSHQVGLFFTFDL